jgi:hypothetical protein
VHRRLDIADRLQLSGSSAAAAAAVLMWSLPSLVRLITHT